jgi:hypothetical protein
VRIVAPLLALTLAVQPVTAQEDQVGDQAGVLGLPVSLDRIREQLSRPPPRLLDSLKIEPDFSVTIEEEQPRFVEMFSPEDFRGGPAPPGGLYAYEIARMIPGFRPLIGGVNLLALADGIAGAVSSARRRRAEDAARLEVQRAMAEFCAAQPDRGAGVFGCAPAPLR